MVKIVCRALEDKKGEDIVVIDISGLSSIADYFVITNGTNLPHLNTLVREVEKELEDEGYTPNSIEGGRSSTWVLLDYADIIVHVFTKEDREFYNLERIWRDGRRVPLKDILGEKVKEENE